MALRDPSATPGHIWVSPTFAATDFTGNGSMTWTVQAADVTTFAYVLIGKTMIVTFSITATVVGGTPNTNLQILIPAGKTATKQVITAAGFITDNATDVTGAISVAAGATLISIFKTDSSNFTAGAVAAHGQIAFEIN